MIWQRARHQAVTVEGQKRCAAARAQSRLSIVALCALLCYAVIMLRIMDLTIVQSIYTPAAGEGMEVEQQNNVDLIAARRGDIYDRNGFLIATTLKTTSLFVDPLLVLEPQKLLSQVHQVIPKLDLEEAVEAIHADNRFGWLAHNLSPAQQRAILEIGDPALGFQPKYTRIYPQGSLFAHMVGYTDTDGLGLAGIERSYDDVLSAGQDVHLTLDLRLQHLTKRELMKSITDFEAVAGVGLILDAQSGEVLAGISLPDFDLNRSSTASSNQKFNRLTLGVYELGSVFKIFSTAAALELKDLKMSHVFDAKEPIKVGWHTIRDFHAKKREMTLPEVFMYSSNIGSARMGEMIGEKGLKNFYSDLGLMKRASFCIKEIGAPIIPTIWRKSTVMTVSYGHGIATSPLQMSAAVGTILNGGYALTPHLVKSYGAEGDGEQEGLQSDSGALKTEKIQILSEETSKKMRQLLRLVVTKGTAKKADVKGLVIGGKTGTAEKNHDGRYDRSKLISSFVGAFPMNDPRYVIMVMVDEPKGQKESYGYATAGWVAAPAAKRIATSMASVLGLQRTKDLVEIDAELWPYIEELKSEIKHVRSKPEEMPEDMGEKKLASY